MLLVRVIRVRFMVKFLNLCGCRCVLECVKVGVVNKSVVNVV